MGLSGSKRKAIDSPRRASLFEEARLRRIESDHRLEYTVQYAQAGLRSLFLANGGAVIALLTLVGNTGREVGANGLFWSFIWFGAGLGCCLAAYFFGANSQDHLMNAAFNEAHKAIAEATESGETFDPDSWDGKAQLALKIAGGLAISSLIFFLVGAFVALFAIT